jgi:hypothetical protein
MPPPRFELGSAPFSEKISAKQAIKIAFLLDCSCPRWAELSFHQGKFPAREGAILGH